MDFHGGRLRIVDNTPDLILYHGNIITVDPDSPRAEAVAIKDGKFVAVGPNEAILRLRGPATRVVDLQGRTCIPGINDPHNHMLMSGHVLTEVQLFHARSISDIQEAVAKAVADAPPGAWILGRGWDESLLREKRFPTRWDLDEVAPNNPVVLERVWNMLVANSAALMAADIGRHTPDPDPTQLYSGRIDRDDLGEPTGVLRDRAKQLVYDAIPPRTDAEREAHLRIACREYNRWGITSIADPGLLPEGIHAYQAVWRDGALSVRSSLCLAGWGSSMEPREELLERRFSDVGLFTGFGNTELRIDTIKMMPDGGVGDRTAYMFEPYRDEPDNFGQYIVSPSDLVARVQWCHEHGWSIDAHTCGDRMQEMVVEAYANAYQQMPSTSIRHRVHHAYFPTEKALELMREYRIAALPTIPFLYNLGESFVASIGEERAARAMPLLTYLEAGVPIACGSDSPVTTYNPFIGIYSCVARKTVLGRDLGPEERVSREEAIRLYTAAGAWVTFEEEIKGTVTPGKLADLVVLDRDILTVPEEELKEIRPVATFLGGRAVYVNEKAWADGALS
ncbi:amidohydrolase [Sphaerobacter thermophilus]|nr:amidohydrolase [Sphaerobacter thermophilus]